MTDGVCVSSAFLLLDVEECSHLLDVPCFFVDKEHGVDEYGSKVHRQCSLKVGPGPGIREPDHELSLQNYARDTLSVTSCCLETSQSRSDGMSEGSSLRVRGVGGADAGVWSCRNDLGDVNF
jgi:hypothetical protein